MSVQIHPSWAEKLHGEFEKDYFQKLTETIKKEIQAGKPIYPEGKKIFAAFNDTPFDAVRVVIIGQDPYHGAGQANGLCFSVNAGVTFPPSLVNIFKELQSDLNLAAPGHGDLKKWAKQGVLMLNAVLTVRKNEAASHQGIGWEIFTNKVIEILDAEKENLVFLLWGNYAQEKGKIISAAKHYILKSGHPSPLSANKGKWFGNKHFSKCNTFLESNGYEPIDWLIN
jgi:uracil-DNA glycosylase